MTKPKSLQPWIRNALKDMGPREFNFTEQKLTSLWLSKKDTDALLSKMRTKGLIVEQTDGLLQYVDPPSKLDGGTDRGSADPGFHLKDFA